MWTWQSGKVDLDLAFFGKVNLAKWEMPIWQKHKKTKENLAK